MATVTGSFRRAVAAHREALGLLRIGRGLLDQGPAEPLYRAQSLVRQAEIVTALREVTEALPPGWWTSSWKTLTAKHPLGEGTPNDIRSLLRIGTAAPVEDYFPVLVPFLGSHHLAVDADARDARVAALIRGVLLRSLAVSPVGALRVLTVDAVTLGATFSPFADLMSGDLMSDPGTDLDALRRVLSEAEEHVRWAQSVPRDDRSTVLLAVAGLPSGWTRDDLSRLASLAHAGPEAGIQLLLAGYPPASPGGASAPTLENTVTIRVTPEEVRLGNIPTTPLGADGLNCPVQLDPAPPDHLVGAVCQQLAHRAGQDTRVGFAQLIAPDLWAESSIDGLRTIVGRAGRGGRDPVWLSLDDSTPHWLVGGRTGSGKTVFLLGVLYGLASRYSPDDLALYLLDFKEGVSFTEFTPTEMDPTWIPHARTVGVESDREYGVAVLAALSAEMNRRATIMKQAGATKLAQLRQARPDTGLPRILAVIDEFHVLFAGNDTIARRAGELLEDIARKGRSYGIHLILASQTTSGIETLFAKGEAIFGQFSQRIALAGGRGALALLNDAADALPLGEAIVNSAAGVPSANRKIRFPDTDPEAVRQVRT
ncbi:MAG: FtsK/SpoIIIE domain-containing protein, partial [Kineosporiaceae bacterium]